MIQTSHHGDEKDGTSTPQKPLAPASWLVVCLIVLAGLMSVLAFKCGEVSEGPIGHDWSAPTYIWSSDNSGVTAKRSCSVCGESETETVKTTGVVSTAATCTEKGKTTYMAIFENGAFSGQSKTVADIPAAGHHYDAPTYTWSSDNRTVLAESQCLDCGEKVTELVPSSSMITTYATCTAMGETSYTAQFANALFTTQAKTLEDVPVVEHQFAAATFDQPKTCVVCGFQTGTPLPKLSSLTPTSVSPSGGLITYYTNDRYSYTYGQGISYQLRDNFGNVYDEAIGGMTANQNNWAEYHVADRYRSISGIVFLNYRNKDDTARNVKFTISGYDQYGSDLGLLFDSGIIQKGVSPIPFTVDISGVDYIRLCIYGDEYLRLAKCCVSPLADE